MLDAMLAMLALVGAYAAGVAAGCAWVLAALLAMRLVRRRQRRRWDEPLARLLATLDRGRQGEPVIDELAAIDGPLAPVAAHVRELLVQLKRRRSDQAEAEQELRQRLRQRNEALERLVGSLRNAANRDPLTGLFNRRGLESHLRSLLERAATAGSDLCVIAMDLDRFKQLNDTLGHAAGDQFLKNVGQIVRSTIREHDAAFRCGGDEFVIVLPDATPAAGAALARRLVCLVDALGRTCRVAAPPGLSAGCAAFSEVGVPRPEALLREADKRLYEFKAARRAVPAPAPAPAA